MVNSNQNAGQLAQIFSLGSVNADFQVRIERRPQISETVMADDFVRLSGGKSANVAFLACKLGANVQLIAHTGDDDLAEQALGSLRGIGVDLSQIKKLPGKHTGVAMITVPPDGKKGIIMAANANQCWADEDIDRVAQTIRSAPAGSVLVVNCEIPASVVQRAMHAAKNAGVKTILDPSPANEVTDQLLELADIVTPNPSEAKSLTGIECKDTKTAIQAGQRLRERGVAIACVKLPDGGCVVVSSEQVMHIGTSPVKVVDTTGAGDAFAGALAVAMLEKRSPAEAARFAVAASHLAVTGYGSQPAYPAREDIEDLERHLDIHTDAEHD